MQQKKDELNLLYAERSDRIHTVTQLLRAYSLYEKDDEYVVTDDGKVLIVDEFTGRLLPGRRYSDGLHQAIEAKEGVKVERDMQTLATITLQNYFRLYKKLAGMTGTAETEAAEFFDIYKLDVVVIPTNKPMVRDDINDVVYKTKREKYNAVIEEIEKMREQKRPVLVGTTSVEVSETISRMLKRRNVSAQRAECEAASAGGGDRVACRSSGRRHHRHEHGGPRNGHQARTGSAGCGRTAHHRNGTSRSAAHRPPAPRPLGPPGGSRVRRCSSFRSKTT